MNFRWFIPFGVLFCLNALVVGGVPPGSEPGKSTTARLSAGYLLIPVESQAGSPCFQKIPYEPEPGDILLFNLRGRFYHYAFKLARSGAPMHAAIVIARDDGTPAILELTGPTVINAKVVILDVEPRLSTYPGEAMVRRIRRPLTPEQSHDLTCFAKSQLGRDFAFRRILMFGTPINPHRGLRRHLFGHTYLDRDRWFCSEMVVAAGTVVHLFDPHIHFANATLPRDLAFDDTMDISAHYHPIASWVPDSSHTAQTLTDSPVKNRN